MLNKVMIIGNLGRDPEVRSTASGQPVADFSVATTRKWRDRDGNRQEQTEWHNVVCWGKQAEIAGQYLRKGKQVFIEGRLQTRSWDDKNSGEKRYKTEIIVENFQMLGSRQGGGEYDGDPGPAASGSYGGGGGGGSRGGQDLGHSEPDDDDIPF